MRSKYYMLNIPSTLRCTPHTIIYLSAFAIKPHNFNAVQQKKTDAFSWIAMNWCLMSNLMLSISSAQKNAYNLPPKANIVCETSLSFLFQLKFGKINKKPMNVLSTAFSVLVLVSNWIIHVSVEFTRELIFRYMYLVFA